MTQPATAEVGLTRPRRIRRRRRVLVWVGISALSAGVLAALATFLLFGPLSAVPATTFDEDTSIRLENGAVVADVPVGAGWTRLGVLPPSAEAALVSPDGSYRLEIRLLPAGSTLQDELDREVDDPADAPQRDWKTETFTGGQTARHLDLVGGESTTTVVGVERPDGAALILTARVATADAERYRPLTASIVGRLGDSR